MYRIACLILTLGFAANAFAGYVGDRKNEIIAHAGIDEGGLVIGGDFYVRDSATESYGAYFRLYSEKEDQGVPSIVAIGISGRGHVKAGIFEYYIAPGFGLLQHNLAETELLIGPTLSYGVTAEVDSSFGLGVENTKLYSWGGKYKGEIKDTFLAHVSFRL